MSDLTPRDRAQRGYSLLLQLMTHGSAKNLAEKMGVSDTTLSEIKTKHAEKVLLLLAHLGLRVVSSKSKCVSPAAYQFLVESHARLNRVAPELVWGDEEEAEALAGGFRPSGFQEV